MRDHSCLPPLLHLPSLPKHTQLVSVCSALLSPRLTLADCLTLPAPSRPGAALIDWQWDRISLHRMLQKIVSQPAAENSARRLPKLKVRRARSVGAGVGWGR